MPNNLESLTAPGVQAPVSSGATIFATDTAPKQLSDGNAAGTNFGLTTADLIGFFSAAMSIQPQYGYVSQAPAFVIGGGSVMTLATSQSPIAAGVAAGNTSEASFTLLSTTANMQVISGDLLYINKPTAQASLGVGNVRVSATNVAAVTFNNVSTAATTPTAGEKYGFVALRGFQTITQTITPAVIPAQTTLEQQFPITLAGQNVLAGEILQVMKPTRQAFLDVVGCRVVSPNVVGITFMNLSTAPTTPTAGEQYTYYSVGAIGMMDNQVSIQAPLTNSAAVASTALTELIMAVSSITTQDTVYGFSKPTFQSAVMPLQTRVSAGGNVVAVTFMGTSSTATTPVSNEIYGLSVWRPQPAAAMISYSVALTPASVASQAAAEQIFTVTGVLAGSMVWVNKPSFTSGLGIAGVRAVSNVSNSIGINFVNATTAAITPPAETYLVANYQQIVPDVGVSWIFTWSAAAQRNRILLGRIRDAMVGLGLTTAF
jgi:hypothetical protein